MKKGTEPVKAYKNLDFLNSSDARTIRILSEFYEPQSRFKKHNIIDTIVFFGSARLVSSRDARKRLAELKKEKNQKTASFKAKLKKAEQLLIMAKYYDDAVELSSRLTEWSMNLPVDEKRFIICSGGGPGIMEAANKGAKKAGGTSIGLNISIPTEQFANKYIDPDHVFEFHYFFMRKFWFMYLAKALVVFPGGFGTLDEMMEVLTLDQTDKIKKKMKIVIYDSNYWKKIINFDALIESGMISKSDMNLFDFCETIDDVFNCITDHFKKHYLNNGNGKK